MPDDFRSGDALFTFGADLTILTWNSGAEELTGISAEEAVGRRCWEVLGGTDERGALVCHAGCSNARLAAEGWPVCGHRLTIKTSTGHRPVTLSTITLRRDGDPVILHLLQNGPDEPVERESRPPAAGEPSLTPREREVLGLLAEGVPAKMIARRLGITEATVRNHIRMILLELDAHSQLEALARARRWHLVG